MRVPLLLIVVTGLSLVTTRAEEPRAIYDRECAKCHGADGRGDTKLGKRVGARDYTDPKVQAELKDDKAFRSIKDGLAEGDKVLMKPAADLSNGQIRRLVTYMRGFKKG